MRGCGNTTGRVVGVYATPPCQILSKGSKVAQNKTGGVVGIKPLGLLSNFKQ